MNLSDYPTKLEEKNTELNYHINYLKFSQNSSRGISETDKIAMQKAILCAEDIIDLYQNFKTDFNNFIDTQLNEVTELHNQTVTSYLKIIDLLDKKD